MVRKGSAVRVRCWASLQNTRFCRHFFSGGFRGRLRPAAPRVHSGYTARGIAAVSLWSGLPESAFAPPARAQYRGVTLKHHRALGSSGNASRCCSDCYQSPRCTARPDRARTGGVLARVSPRRLPASGEAAGRSRSHRCCERRSTSDLSRRSFAARAHRRSARPRRRRHSRACFAVDPGLNQATRGSRRAAGHRVPCRASEGAFRHRRGAEQLALRPRWLAPLSRRVRGTACPSRRCRWRALPRPRRRRSARSGPCQAGRAGPRRR